MAVSDVASSFATSAGTYVSGSPVDRGRRRRSASHLVARPATAEALTPVVLDEKPVLSPELPGRARA